MIRALRHWWYVHVWHYGQEMCDDCARPVARGIGTWWNADDELWRQVVTGDAVHRDTPTASGGRRLVRRAPTDLTLCPKCFAARAATLGWLIYFDAQVSRD